MSEQNESLVRGAYEAYRRGDTAKLLDIIDPGLEWTYLDPSSANPEPQTCHGREQLQSALQGQAERGLRSEEEDR
jgi:ketosteroid isomerase-like protein